MQKINQCGWFRREEESLLILTHIGLGSVKAFRFRSLVDHVKQTSLSGPLGARLMRFQLLPPFKPTRPVAYHLFCYPSCAFRSFIQEWQFGPMNWVALNDATLVEVELRACLSSGWSSRRGKELHIRMTGCHWYLLQRIIVLMSNEKMARTHFSID